MKKEISYFHEFSVFLECFGSRFEHRPEHEVLDEDSRHVTVERDLIDHNGLPVHLFDAVDVTETTERKRQLHALITKGTVSSQCDGAIPRQRDRPDPDTELNDVPLDRRPIPNERHFRERRQF